jgi:hypothetical protein
MTDNSRELIDLFLFGQDVGEIQGTDDDGGGGFPGGFSDLDHPADERLGILTGDAVDLNQPFTQKLREGPGNPGDGELLPVDLDHVAQNRIDRFDVVGIEAGKTLAHILGEGFADFEFQGPIHNGTLSRLRFTGTIILGMII